MRYINLTIPELCSDDRNNLSVLEIGSADGTFSKMLYDTFFLVECCEVDSNLAQVTEEQGFKTFDCDFMEIPEYEQFDVAIAIDLLEHILDIKEFANKVSRSVSKYMIIQIPNRMNQGDPNKKGKFGGHSHCFSALSIQILFDKWFRILGMYETEKGDTARGKEMLIIFERKDNNYH